MLKDTGVALLELHEQALLEELLRTQSAGLNIALLLLLLLAVAITAYYMTAAPAAKKTPADRQAAPAPAPAPPRESTKSERSSEEIRPRPSLQGLSSAAPEASEAARGAGAAAAAAPQMTLGVPALSDVQLFRDAALNYDVRDSSGGKLIHISLVSPHADMVEDPSAPVEYVTLSSPDQAEELAMCAVLPSPGGGGWQCNVYQGDGSDDDFVGTLAKTRGSTGEEEFTLTSDRGARLLLIQGSVQRRQLKVTGSSGAMTASVQPSGGFFSSSYYEAACAVDADVGLTVLALLGVDRLVWRQRADAGR